MSQKADNSNCYIYYQYLIDPRPRTFLFSRNLLHNSIIYLGNIITELKRDNIQLEFCLSTFLFFKRNNNLTSLSWENNLHKHQTQKARFYSLSIRTNTVQALKHFSFYLLIETTRNCLRLNFCGGNKNKCTIYLHVSDAFAYYNV